MKNLQNILVLSFAVLIIGALQVSSQWEPPSTDGPDNNVPAPIHIGSEPQIKNAALGINLSNVVHTITTGSALDVYNGSIFIRSGSTSTSWTPSADFAVDTSLPIASHGILSTGNIYTAKSLVSNDLAGGSATKTVCADSSGRLIACSVGSGGPIGDPTTLNLTLISEPIQTEIAYAEIVLCGSPGSSDLIVAGDPRYCYKFSAADPFVVQYDVQNATACFGQAAYVSGPKRTLSTYPVVLESRGPDAKSATITVKDYPDSKPITEVSNYDYVLTCSGGSQSKSVTSRLRVYWSTKQ